MSHVDEGTLHALVDNALSPAERTAAEAHLASCGECARQFADATAMARQVHTLLGALDEVPAPLRIETTGVAASGRAAALVAANVTPLQRRMRTLRRVALAASVLAVAGISYRVGTSGITAPTAEPASAIADVRPVRPATVPSVVEASPDAIVLPSAPTVRVAPRGGPRAEQETEVGAGGVAAPLTTRIPAPPLAAVPPVAPREERVALPSSPIASAASAEEAVERGAPRRAAPDESVERGASRRAVSDEAADRTAPRRAADDVGSGGGRRVAQAPAAAAPMAAAVGASANGAAKVSAGPLAGYQAVDEETVPQVTRRRYVAADGTTLLLVIAPTTADAVSRSSGKAATEFTVSTVKGRSTVRWQSSGLSYELQGALTADSLVKLATQLK